MRALRIRCLLGTAVVASALVLPATASAATTCTNGATLTVDHTGGIDDVTIRVNTAPNPDTIVVVDGSGTLACAGGTPTVTSVGTLAYTNSGGISFLFLEEPDLLAPGSALEIGSVSEIEVTLSEPSGIIGDVTLRDTDGSGDAYTLGTNGINLNGDNDPDITFGVLSLDFILEGGASADIFDARGGAGTGAAYTEGLELRGGEGADQLFGGSGFDRIEGGGGDDTIGGGEDFDRLDGGPGNDSIDGGPDDDELSYANSTSPVNIDLAAAGPQNGGSLGIDTITSVERLIGSPEGDILRGDDLSNDINGGPGDDLLEGRGGSFDFLDGSGGFDTASYESASAPVTVDLRILDSQDTLGAGMDFFNDGDIESLLGSASADTLLGSNGINRLDGGPGTDSISAFGGDDLVLARDGAADTVDCGDGADRGSFDRRSLEGAVTSCEAADFLPEPDTAVSLSVRTRAQKLLRRAIRVVARCGDEACTVRAAASLRVPGVRRRLRFRGVRATVAAGQGKTLVLRLSTRNARRVLKALRAGRRLVVGVRVTATDGAGNTATDTSRVRLRR
jgi:Ca2+-binding RTX toxin-like protein